MTRGYDNHSTDHESQDSRDLGATKDEGLASGRRTRESCSDQSGTQDEQAQMQLEAVAAAG